MEFIGIITNKKSEVKFKQEVEKFEKNNYSIIYLNSQNIDNFKNVSFKTILLCYSYKTMCIDLKLFRGIISNSKKLIINTDYEENYEVFDNTDIEVITYGFNNKATISFSSNDEDVIMCVQRNIMDIKDTIIEPQDIKMNIKNNMMTSYEKHGIFILYLIYF